MTKILYIISDQGLGGSSRHLLDLMNGINKNSFRPILLSASSSVLNRSRNITTYAIDMKSRIDLKAIKEIKNILNKEKPDLIHLHATRAGLLGTYSAIKTKIPVIYTEHLFTKDYVPHNSIIYSAQIFAFRKLAKHINRVIAVSGAVKKYLIDKKIFSENKIEIIHNGVKINGDYNKINHLNISKHNRSKIIIGTVGSLNKLKGQKYLIEGFGNLSHKFTNFQLEIVGSGPDRDYLMKIAKNLNLQKKIKFHGREEDVSRIMNRWDIYVQPSLSESFGLSVAEAMSVGIPVVATATGGLTELINNDSGILVRPKDPYAISCAIMKLAMDSKLRHKIGQQAKNRIEKNFSLENMLKKTEKLYHEEIAKIRS